MKSVIFGILSFVFIQFAFAQSNRPLREKIKDLENELRTCQKSIEAAEKVPGNVEERNALRSEIRQKLSQSSYLIYEYGHEATRQLDHVALFNSKVLLNMISETLSTARPPNAGLSQPEYPLEPIFGAKGDAVRTADILLLQDYPLEKKFDKRIRETKDVKKLLYAWVDDKNLNVVKDYVIQSPTGVKDERRKVLSNHEVPLAIIHDVKTFDQFQVLRSFVEARYTSREPANWDLFNILLSEVKTSERGKLAAAMMFAKQKDWDLWKMIEALRMTRDPDVARPKVPRKNIDSVLHALGVDERELADSPKMKGLKSFLNNFTFEAPLQGCYKLLL